MISTVSIKWKEFGKLCWRTRVFKKRLTLTEMAKQLKISVGTLWRVEKGGDPPKLTKLKTICKFLDVDFEQAKEALKEYKHNSVDKKLEDTQCL